jgi:hypothetical protein
VFLLSALSYRLLSKEQGKEKPNPNILDSIKLYMYINLVLAVLSLAAPIIDKKQSTTFTTIEPIEQKNPIKAEIGVVENGEAAVCRGQPYQNRYLLLQDINTNKLIEVLAVNVTICPETTLVQISETDASYLGWDPEAHGSYVRIDVAPLGFKFAIENQTI